MKFINRKILLIGGIATAVLLIIGGLYLKGILSTEQKGEVLAAEQNSNVEAVSIETVGDNHATEMDGLGISWPGEIVSLGNIEIQPQREGTITEWKVNIGQKVFKGQILGRLSAPPATPELTQMLAEQNESLAKARGQAQAIANFAEKNKLQLIALREALGKNNIQIEAGANNAKDLSISKSAIAARTVLDQSRLVAEVKRKKARTTIEQGIVKTFPLLTGSYNDPLSLYKTNGYFPIYFPSSIGLTNSQSRDKYVNALFKLLNDLKDPNALPQESGQAYFSAALSVVSASFAGDGITEQYITDLREAVTVSQSEAIEAIKEYEEAKLETANKDSELVMAETGYAEQIKEIDEKIAMLEKDQQMAMAEVKASEAAYGTVSGSINGGLNITSPQNGVVSAIYKKNGEFVSPGMPVASINSGDNKERFVRFYIPSNLAMPEPGTELTIMRPGFANNSKKVKLIGTGTALSGNGSYAADAKFIDQIDWPVGGSVRVMPPQGLVSTISVALAAVWWNDNAEANVWLVTEENRIRPQQIKIGRTLGDRLEVLEGLQPGNRYALKALPGMVAGQMLTDVKVEAEQQTNDSNSSEESAHSHDE